MLEVYLTTNGHGFRGTLFHLLKKTYELRKLHVILLNCVCLLKPKFFILYFDLLVCLFYKIQLILVLSLF